MQTATREGRAARATRRATAAAVVNGILVFLLPLALRLGDASESSVTVRPSGWSGAAGMIRGFLTMAWPMLPFSLVAVWRTRVHAMRWMTGARTWRGVGEAGLTGFGVAVIALSRALVMQPADTLPYLLAYGALGFVAGLAVGLALQLIAVVILTFTE